LDTQRCVPCLSKLRHIHSSFLQQEVSGEIPSRLVRAGTTQIITVVGPRSVGD
jgi:hypothetical protein